MSTFFFNPEPRSPQPQVAGYYNNLSQLVKLPFKFKPTSCVFRIMLPPKELRIIQGITAPSNSIHAIRMSSLMTSNAAFKSLTAWRYIFLPLLNADTFLILLLWVSFIHGYVTVKC